MNIISFLKKYMLEIRGKKKKSYMIALYPSKESIEKLKELQKEFRYCGDTKLQDDEFHSTIRYWRIEDGGSTIEILKGFQEIDFRPITVSVDRVDVLGDSVSVMFNSEEMQDLFVEVDEIVQSCGAAASDFPNFLPHTALYYDNPILENPFKVKKMTLTFDEIRLVDNLDNVYMAKNWK